VGLLADVGPGPVALDTAVFIYLIEEETRFLPHILPLFMEADQGERVLVTSALTLLEVLGVPYRAGNRQLAERYERLLTTSRGVRLVELTRDQLRAAAQLRAATGLKTPDALQLVAALGAGCKTFITNDRRLPSVPGVQVIQLSSYAAPR
jgi:predicted nucleic acid-binding protein